MAQRDTLDMELPGPWRLSFGWARARGNHISTLQRNGIAFIRASTIFVHPFIRFGAYVCLLVVAKTL